MEEKIRRALVSVSNKDGIVEFSRGISELGVELVGTGRTRQLLLDEGIECRAVEDVTSFPEMMGGRVKTLHPRILGGILARRDVKGDVDAANKHGIPFFDLVVVNLYPFQEAIQKHSEDLGTAVEQIDIGGPTMVRAAAKNFRHVAVVVDPDRYRDILEELRTNDCSLEYETRLALSIDAFSHVSLYDSIITRHLRKFLSGQEGTFPQELVIPFVKNMELRYGENPHQKAAFYTDPITRDGWTSRFDQLGGKALSTNNILDADSAWRLIAELEGTACAIIKHNNPCGVGVSSTLNEAYSLALQTDPVSAFGGIVAVNETVDEKTATLMSKHFFEVVMAPDFDSSALDLLKKKKNLRILRIEPGSVEKAGGFLWDVKTVEDGALIQERDTRKFDQDKLKVVTAVKPTEDQRQALELAWIVAKHVKSNSIVLANETGTLGIGAGQMSRVDSVRISIDKAKRFGLSTEGAVMASDAFFPFRDGLDEAASAGVKAVIQPGGSIRDEEVIKAADEHGVTMIFTGMRHFRH